MPTEPDPATSRRLQRVEEQHAFAERTIEQLNDEIIAAHERLGRVIQRVEALEQTLQRLTEPADDEADDQVDDETDGSDDGSGVSAQS